MADKAPHAKWTHDLAFAVPVAVLYFAGARLGLAFVVKPEGLAVLWPSAGVLLGALCISRRAAWPPLVAVVFVVVTLSNRWLAGNSIPLSLGFALAKCTESLVVAAVVTGILGRTPLLGRLQDVVVFTAVGAVATNAVTALLGAAVVHLGTGGPFWSIWGTWWVEDGVGMLVVGAAFIETCRSFRTRLEPAKFAETSVLIVLLGGGSLWLFTLPPSSSVALLARPYLILPVLALVAIRLGALGAAWGTLVVAAAATWGAVRGLGVFHDPGSATRVVILTAQIFVAVASVSALGAAALYSERRLFGDRRRQTLYELNRHLENSPLAVVEFDGEYRITRWVGRSEAIFGWSAGEVLGKRIDEFPWVHEGDAERVSELMADMVAGRQLSNVTRNRNWHKDGSVVYCEWYNSALLDSDGKMSSLLSEVLDVTEREQAKEELETLYEQARKDAEVKARLLLEVNHRVKNNLISLLGMVLADKRLGPSGEEAPFDVILERMKGRIGSLLAAHELLSARDWEPLRVTELARKIMRGMVGRNVQIDIPFSDVLASPRQVSALTMVLNELATNTAKHGGDGVRHVRVAVTQEGDFLRVEYRDDGSGYPAEVLAGEMHNVGLRLTREIAEGTLRGSLSFSNDGGAVAVLLAKAEELSST